MCFSAPATPRTIAITQSMDVSSVVATDGKIRHPPPPFSGRRDEGFDPPGGTPHSARAQGSRSPPGLTSRSALTPPNNPSPTPRKRNGQEGCGGGGLDLSGPPDPSPPTDTNMACFPCSGERSPTANIGGDSDVAHPDSCAAAIPSAICTIADGVAASCVSPRSNVYGYARQLAVTTQYLNRSLFIPTPPQQPIGNCNDSGRVRPATAGAETDVLQTGRGYVAGHGCKMIDSRPRTTSTEPRERSRLYPLIEGQVIWRSSLPGEDGQGRDLAASGLSSRPLTRTRAAPDGIGSPSGVKGNPPMAGSPRKPIVVASPGKVAHGGTRGISPFSSINI